MKFLLILFHFMDFGSNKTYLSRRRMGKESLIPHKESFEKISEQSEEDEKDRSRSISRERNVSIGAISDRAIGSDLSGGSDIEDESPKVIPNIVNLAKMPLNDPIFEEKKVLPENEIEEQKSKPIQKINKMNAENEPIREEAKIQSPFSQQMDDMDIPDEGLFFQQNVSGSGNVEFNKGLASKLVLPTF